MQHGGAAPSADMVSYGYGSGLATAVELESASEVRSHPEKVLSSMEKCRGTGFDRCDVWSASPRIAALRGRVSARLRGRVRCHIVGEAAQQS